QDAVQSPFSSGDLIIISHIFRFVKYFFQIFSGNFLQTFFPKSKKHFLTKFLYLPVSPSDSFIIISCFFSIVKQNKFLFFRCFFVEFQQNLKSEMPNI
ncbi:MAG TPA: hypothetical protein DCG30_03965, partial [Ruminococcus sp.]|nr:hypothetical protein [Ruminococcus sp.]